MYQFDPTRTPQANLGAFLADEGFAAELLAERETYRIRFSAGNGDFDLYLLIPSASATLACYALPEHVVPPERRAVAAEFVVRANWGLRVGGFELNLDSGEIRYKVTLDFYGTPLGGHLIRNALRGCTSTLDQYLPALSALLKEGLTPKEALARVEPGGAP